MRHAGLLACERAARACMPASPAARADPDFVLCSRLGRSKATASLLPSRAARASHASAVVAEPRLRSAAGGLWPPKLCKSTTLAAWLAAVAALSAVLLLLPFVIFFPFGLLLREEVSKRDRVPRWGGNPSPGSGSATRSASG